MSGTFKVKNKETGEIFTVRAKQKSATPVKKDIPNKAFGLGKTDVVENIIEQRDPHVAFQNYKALKREREEKFKQHPIKEGLKTLINPAKNIKESLSLVGGIAQRLESAIANPLIEMQKSGELDPMVLGQSAIDGLIGKRGGEVGDIMRNTLYSANVSPEITEAVAGATGLLGMAGVYKGLGKLTQSRPKVMTNKWKINTVKQAHQGVVEAKASAGTQYDKIYTPVQNNPITKGNVLAELKKIPAGIRKQFGIDLKNTKNITVGQLKDIRKGVTDRISDSSWVQAQQGRYPSLTATNLQSISKNLKNIILDNVDDATRKQIMKLDPKYADIVNKGQRIIKDVFDSKTGTYKTSKILNMFKDKTTAGEQEVYSSYGQYSKALESFVKDMHKYAFRQKAKAVSGQIGKWAAISGGVGMGTNYLVDAIKNITGEK
ncbi:MAG: hypothetical protein GY861_01430 [bacterium]|nr:hypothetical protein [bacterium]